MYNTRIRVLCILSISSVKCLLFVGERENKKKRNIVRRYTKEGRKQPIVKEKKYKNSLESILQGQRRSIYRTIYYFAIFPFFISNGRTIDICS